MIISASYRTDIPAFYSAWFRARLAAGFVRVANPYGGPPQTVALTPDSAEGFVFWTRNLEPFFAVLDQLAAEGRPFLVHNTITGYSRPLDAATIAPERAVAHLQRVAGAFGPRVGVWRYDPIVLSSLTPPDWHRATFERLARALEGIVDEVVMSFVHVYRKTARNMTAAARTDGFDWEDPESEVKRHLLADLAAIAEAYQIAPTLCGQPELRVRQVNEARCIDAERLNTVSPRPIDASEKPHRETCGCWASKDIGAYDTCPHGCVYCYAVNNRRTAKRRFAAHDAAGAFLVAPSAK